LKREAIHVPAAAVKPPVKRIADAEPIRNADPEQAVWLQHTSNFYESFIKLDDVLEGMIADREID
jgi:hypothetical protein